MTKSTSRETTAKQIFFSRRIHVCLGSGSCENSYFWKNANPNAVWILFCSTRRADIKDDELWKRNDFWICFKKKKQNKQTNNESQTVCATYLHQVQSKIIPDCVSGPNQSNTWKHYITAMSSLIDQLQSLQAHFSVFHWKIKAWSKTCPLLSFVRAIFTWKSVSNSFQRCRTM